MISGIFRFVVIGVLIAVSIGLLGTVAFSWSLDTSPYLSGLTSFLHVVYYVLPIGQLSPIIFCFLGLQAFRIIVAFVRTLWSLIPVRG